MDNNSSVHNLMESAKSIGVGIGGVCYKKEKVVNKILMTAKKDFVIRHNSYLREIKTGDDVSDVPEIYIQNLKTEGVL